MKKLLLILLFVGVASLATSAQAARVRVRCTDGSCQVHVHTVRLFYRHRPDQVKDAVQKEAVQKSAVQKSAVQKCEGGQCRRRLWRRR